MSLFRLTNNLLSPKPTEINSQYSKNFLLNVILLAEWMTQLSTKVQDKALTRRFATHSIKMTT